MTTKVQKRTIEEVHALPKEKKISPELEAKLLKFYEQFTEKFVTNLDKAA